MGERDNDLSHRTTPDPPEGVEFGDYVLLRKLGGGGMAEVYLGRPKDPRRSAERLAIKRPLQELVDLPDFERMFDREIRVASRLHHPNIVRVRDHGVVGTQPFIATEYVEGLDCWKITRRMARLGEALALAHVVQIVEATLSGLDYLHRIVGDDGRPLGIVHRDISPSNIFVSRRGDVKVGDLGIALIPSEEVETRRRKRLRGKIRFLSPEQIAGFPLDARSDLFAVGVLLAELILGRSPFQGQTDLAVLLNIRDVRLNLSEGFEANIPKGLQALLLRSLDRDPSARHASAAAMREELLAFADRERIDLDPASLASRVERLLKPGDVGDVDILRSTLTPLENAPIGPRDLPSPTERTPAISSVEYRVRRADGTEVGPMPYASLADAVMEGRVTALDMISADGGGFLPVTAVSGIRDHLPLLEQTTTGVIVPQTPERHGRLEADTVPGVFIALAAERETGLLVIDTHGLRKEVYLVEGNPLYVSSNIRSEQLGEYLVSRGVISRLEHQMAAAVLPRYRGQMADALIAMEVVDPMTLFEHLANHVRQRLLDVYAWKSGVWNFYRGVRCERDFYLLPSAADLLHQGIDRSLPEGDEDDWWTSTAPLDLTPVANPTPPRHWWTIDDADRLVLDVVDRRMSAAEALGLVAQRSPAATRPRAIRAFHFCLTCGLLGIAFG